MQDPDSETKVIVGIVMNCMLGVLGGGLVLAGVGAYYTYEVTAEGIGK